jgi:YD repeat-containing protein
MAKKILFEVRERSTDGAFQVIEDDNGDIQTHYGATYNSEANVRVGVTAVTNPDSSVTLYAESVAIQTGGTQTVTSITNNTDGTVNTYVKNGITYTVSYNAAGYVSAITGSNGSTVTPTYDVNNAVTAVTVA